jgi:uncharacterized membrane protein
VLEQEGSNKAEDQKEGRAKSQVRPKNISQNYELNLLPDGLCVFLQGFFRVLSRLIHWKKKQKYT